MHHRPVLVAALAIVLEAGLSVLAPAQTRAPDVGVGFGVDTSRADVGAIVRLVRVYLNRPDSVARSRVLWSAGPSGDRTYDDLAARYALQGAPASIIGVLPVDDGDSVYVVKLLHARPERAGGPVAPIALERLYAERTPRSPLGWQLAAALPRLTKAWQTRTAGRITFHYAPGQQPNSDRATTAAAFVDSVAALFDVTPPSRIDYYVAGSPDEYFRALGLDFFVLPSGPGESAAGNALPDVGVLLAGDPAQGELYRHELVHVAAGRRIHSAFVGEGVAAWLGGSRRQDARELYRGLAAFQRAHPGVTFAAMVRDKLSAPDQPVASADAWYASGALACEAVFRRAGVQGLRTLADASNEPASIQRALAGLLGIADDSVALDRWWRAAATSLGRSDR